MGNYCLRWENIGYTSGAGLFAAPRFKKNLTMDMCICAYVHTNTYKECL